MWEILHAEAFWRNPRFAEAYVSMTEQQGFLDPEVLLTDAKEAEEVTSPCLYSLYWVS